MILVLFAEMARAKEVEAATQANVCARKTLLVS